MSYRFRVQIYH